MVNGFSGEDSVCVSKGVVDLLCEIWGLYFLKVVVSSYSSIFEKTGLECFQQQLVTDDKRKKLLMQHLYSFNLLPSPHPTSPSLRDFETELKCRHFPNKWTNVFLEEE